MLEETEDWIRDSAGLDADFVVDRIAVTDEDYATPTLPHLPVNVKDVRADEFCRRFGREVVEVEALAPEELQRRLQEAIERHRDEAAWRQALHQEETDQRELERRLGPEEDFE